MASSNITILTSRREHSVSQEGGGNAGSTSDRGIQLQSETVTACVSIEAHRSSVRHSVCQPPGASHQAYHLAGVRVDASVLLIVPDSDQALPLIIHSQKSRLVCFIYPSSQGIHIPRSDIVRRAVVDGLLSSRLDVLT